MDKRRARERGLLCTSLRVCVFQSCGHSVSGQFSSLVVTRSRAEKEGGGRGCEQSVEARNASLAEWAVTQRDGTSFPGSFGGRGKRPKSPGNDLERNVQPHCLSKISGQSRWYRREKHLFTHKKTTPFLEWSAILFFLTIQLWRASSAPITAHRVAARSFSKLSK